MGTSEVFSFFLFFFFLVMILANISVLANDCSISSYCPFGPVTRFPFWRKDQQHDSCGYPGFSLTCKPSHLFGNYLNYTALELPLSGDFEVREIDYVKQEIVLTDPNICLPERLLYTVLNLSDSPFKSVYYQNYTFLNCTRQKIPYGSILSKHILFCLGIENGYVLATSSMTLLGEFQRYCEVIKTVSVPVPVPNGYDSFLGEHYYNNITLSWDEPNCRYCEERNLGCRLRNKNSHETRCVRKKRLTTGAISGISIGIGLPVLLGIIYCVVFCIRVCSEDDVYQPSNVEFSNATSPVQLVISLNDSTIDSYPKIVLGESRRLPKPDDNICPICLSEYLPKEILKIIPECNHNFHADCIDQWLHTNMTCPICRNYPT